MKKRRSAEEVVHLLREADRDLAKGLPLAEICRKAGVAETTYYRWRQKHDPALIDTSQRCHQLEREIKRLVAELMLDSQMLQEVAKRSDDVRPGSGSDRLPQ